MEPIWDMRHHGHNLSTVSSLRFSIHGMAGELDSCNSTGSEAAMCVALSILTFLATIELKSILWEHPYAVCGVAHHQPITLSHDVSTRYVSSPHVSVPAKPSLWLLSKQHIIYVQVDNPACGCNELPERCAAQWWCNVCKRISPILAQRGTRMAEAICERPRATSVAWLWLPHYRTNKHAKSLWTMLPGKSFCPRTILATCLVSWVCFPSYHECCVCRGVFQKIPLNHNSESLYSQWYICSITFFDLRKMKIRERHIAHAAWPGFERTPIRALL